MAKMLGKLPYVHDSRSLKLSDYLTDELPTPPASSNWDHYVKLPWGMMLNSELGDCTCACAGHLILLWTSSAATPVLVPDQAILAAYEAVSGYNPVTKENDNGAQIKDVLNYWRQTGVGGHKIGAFAEVNINNEDELKDAIDIFGGVDIGVQLPLAAQQMGNHWTAPPTNPAPTPAPWWQQFWSWAKKPADTVDQGLTGNWAPGSWGGHCICVVDYDDAAETYTAVSWGELITIEAGFFTAYVDEAWAIVSKDILNAKGDDVKGLDIAQLNADLAEIK